MNATKKRYLVRFVRLVTATFYEGYVTESDFKLLLHLDNRNKVQIFSWEEMQ